MNINKRIKTWSKALLACVCVLIAMPSMATFTSLQSASFSGNDCSSKKNAVFHEAGYNGYNGFNACRIAIDDNLGNTVYLADVIAKFDTNGSSPSYTESGQFAADIQQSDWSFGNVGKNYKTGTWTYTGGSPGIKFWTAKAGNGFNLFWLVDNTPEASNACQPSTFTLACLNLAKTVTSGSWTTPLNKKGNPRGLSHITFFGGTTQPCTSNCGSTTVPEPQTMVLLALALLGLVARQKRSTTKVKKS
ncbi:PEP-CTERM protein-sorting domain-containing protein [Colwellia chukchiensis]|uniref:PEP-CTERM protein-sorting domain-containing protein n=1 Tax=Colwellia chukchiensis TaxID=641665 RepID=A0A1H7KKU8_9GAMM|nr:PEP-CTERM sorting domain-containing protein [Colwellia chukchiensis]SEK87140.1 PEP-CTERM protein-sorting domain-containing protein [Colwellia chukchiensis]